MAKLNQQQLLDKDARKFHDPDAEVIAFNYKDTTYLLVTYEPVGGYNVTYSWVSGGVEHGTILTSCDVQNGSPNEAILAMNNRLGVL